MSTAPVKADIAIIGSGFAGSLCALILDRMGFKTVLIDRSSHPRFAIGESSTPAGNLILRDLATRYDLPRLLPLTAFGPWQETYPHIGCGRKRGFSYFVHQKNRAFIPRPDHANELLVAASKDDYHSDTQWLREDVDAFLYNEARTAGIPVFENTTVQQIERGTVPRTSDLPSLTPGSPESPNLDPTNWHIKATQNGTSLSITARFLIDATGRNSLLARRLDLAPKTSLLRTNTRAVYTHLDTLPPWRDSLAAQGARLEDHPYHCDDAAVHHLLDKGWLWMLRFASGRTSIGLVTPCTGSQEDRPDIHAILHRYPSLASLLDTSTLSPHPGSWIHTDRLQHLWSPSAGPGWALLPYTAGFVDPLHSTGIAHSISGIERLTGLLHAHWDRPTLPAALSRYSQDLETELLHLDRLVSLCYQAMPAFDVLIPCLMLYFASAITYEEDRIACRDRGEPSQRLFLCAEDNRLRDIINAAAKELHALLGESPGSEAIHRVSRRVAELIQPYNTAGLFAPRIPNMYEYTATV